MSYARLLTRLFNTPLMVSQDKLDIITSDVGLRLLAGEALDSNVPTTEHTEVPEEYAVVSVFDSLVSKNGGGSSGSTSYESITSQTIQYIDEGYKTIYYYFDTPGGEVSGLFATSDFIKSLPEKYGVETVGITDGLMASAGYVLGSSVQKLYATETSMVGSIGVIMTLINVVKADKKAGREYMMIRSKSEKALLNPHETFDSGAIEKATFMLAELDTIMNESVLTMRDSLSLQTVIDLKGNVVLGKEALELGLIDGIVSSLQEVLTMKEANTFLTKTGNITMNLEEALSANIQLKDEVAALKANESVVVAAATQTERTRVLGIVEATTAFKLSTASAKKRIVAGSSVEDAVSMFEEIAESTQAELDTVVDASTINKDTVVPTDSIDFHTNMKGALEKVNTESTLFKGMK